MRRVAVVGVGVTKFGKHDRSSAERGTDVPLDGMPSLLERFTREPSEIIIQGVADGSLPPGQLMLQVQHPVGPVHEGGRPQRSDAAHRQAADAQHEKRR